MTDLDNVFTFVNLDYISLPYVFKTNPDLF